MANFFKKNLDDFREFTLLENLNWNARMCGQNYRHYKIHWNIEKDYAGFRLRHALNYIVGY